MGIFKKKTVKPIPEECRGMEIKIMSSTCTGEKTIGFYNRNTREIMYPELVKSDSDVEAFYEKYGLKNVHLIVQQGFGQEATDINELKSLLMQDCIRIAKRCCVCKPSRSIL